MTVERSVKTNLNNKIGDTLISPTVIDDKVNKKTFVATAEGPITQQLKSCIIKIENSKDKTIAFPTNVI